MTEWLLLWLLPSATVLVAAALQGAYGFGVALVMTPILLLMWSSELAVAVAMIVGATVSLVICARELKSIRVFDGAVLYLASIPGTWLGVVFLVLLPQSAIQLLAGIATISAAIPMLMGYTYQLKRERLAMGVGGLLSGFLGSSTGVGGPPIVLLLTNLGWPSRMFRATLSLFFLLSSVTTVCVMGVQSALPETVLAQAVRVMPAALVGVFIGRVVARRITNIERFRKVVITMVFGTGMIVLASGTFGMFS